MTNRQAFRQTASPLCEWEPRSGMPALLSDTYHGIATIEVLGPTGKVQKLRVCGDCAERHFAHRSQRRFLRAGGKPVY